MTFLGWWKRDPFKGLLVTSNDRGWKGHELNHLELGGFLKWWYQTTIGFPTKNDHFGVEIGYSPPFKETPIVDLKESQGLKDIMTKIWEKKIWPLELVGGWTNPSEKYARQIRFIFPNFWGKNKNLWVATRKTCWISKNLKDSLKVHIMTLLKW